MKRTFHIRPGIAAFVGITEFTPDIDWPPFKECSAILISTEKGHSIDRHPCGLEWPQGLKDAINEHFAKVFALRHEDWTEPGPSPRAAYLQQLTPWTVRCEE